MGPWLLPLAWPWATLVSVAVLISLLWQWRRRPELAGPPVALLWDRQGRWYWRLGEEERELRLLGDTYVTPWLVVLNFTAIDDDSRFRWLPRRESLLLWPDSIDPERLRRLRVRLRIDGVEVGEPDGSRD